jgi:hypothetical protein
MAGAPRGVGRCAILCRRSAPDMRLRFPGASRRRRGTMNTWVMREWDFWPPPQPYISSHARPKRPAAMEAWTALLLVAIGQAAVAAAASASDLALVRRGGAAAAARRAAARRGSAARRGCCTRRCRTTPGAAAQTAGASAFASPYRRRRRLFGGQASCCTRPARRGGGICSASSPRSPRPALPQPHPRKGHVLQLDQARARGERPPAAQPQNRVQPRQPAAERHGAARRRRRDKLLDRRGVQGGGGGGGGWRQGGGERRDGPRGANRPVVSAPTPPSPSVQDEPCAPGQPLKKQQRLRLQHASSRKWLHSHLYQSPLSGNQEVRSPGAFIGAAGRAARSEPAPLQARHWAAPINPHAPSRRQVSAFGSDSASDGGDVWTVDWDDRRAGEFWKQDVRVRGGRAEGAQGVGKGGGLQRAPPSQHGRPGARGSAGLAPDAPTRRRAAPTGDPAPRRDRRLPPLPAPRDVRPPTSWAA